MARPKKPDKRQVSFNDVLIEDLEIAELIDEIIEGAAVAKRVRQVALEVKKQLLDKYPDAINNDADGIHSGWANVLGRRIFCGRIDVPEKKQNAKTIAAKRLWVGLDPHRADLFSKSGEAVS